MMELRNFLLPVEREAASKKIEETVLAHAEIKEAAIISTYVSLPEEVDTRSLIRKLLEMDKTVMVPKMIGQRTMVLQKISTLADLVKGPFGILEPKKTCPVVDPLSVQLFIVPGVAFDASGHRLGRGRGYYDSLLANLGAPRIALAFRCQLVAQVPVTSYDISMTAIITEEETIIMR